MSKPTTNTDIVQVATSPQDPKQRLITAIRGWIHMDNLTESFTSQATNARTLRNKHEADALALIKQLGLTKSTIQVSGANLTVGRRKSQTGLTWGYLEREIPAWATQAGLKPTQSAGLVKWLQEHRETKEMEFLKKNL